MAFHCFPGGGQNFRPFDCSWCWWPLFACWPNIIYRGRPLDSYGWCADLFFLLVFSLFHVLMYLFCIPRAMLMLHDRPGPPVGKYNFIFNVFNFYVNIFSLKLRGNGPHKWRPWLCHSFIHSFTEYIISLVIMMFFRNGTLLIWVIFEFME